MKNTLFFNATIIAATLSLVIAIISTAIPNVLIAILMFVLFFAGFVWLLVKAASCMPQNKWEDVINDVYEPESLDCEYIDLSWSKCYDQAKAGDDHE